jgi:hypothetical protein
MYKLLIGMVLGALAAAAALGATTALGKPKEGPCYVAPAGNHYPGDDASARDIAAWMGDAAARAGLPPELPVMAALVDSGLRNLAVGEGDADSAGYFQMRVSFWNRSEYAGYETRPELQLKWFLDHAIAVKTRLIADGIATDDESHYGEWVADVQRPPEQFRYRYQTQLTAARNLLMKR